MKKFKLISKVYNFKDARGNTFTVNFDKNQKPQAVARLFINGEYTTLTNVGDTCKETALLILSNYYEKPNL